MWVSFIHLAALLLVSIFFAPAILTERIPEDRSPVTVSLTEEQTTPAATTTATVKSESESVPETVKVPPKKKVAAVVEPPASSTPISSTVQQGTPAPLLSFDPINDATRAALVNILCTTRGGGSLKPITGSGIIIDSRGIILTNAHVAQYYLLRNAYGPKTVECVIRAGSPATRMYLAEPLYISRQWIEDNKEQITLANPTGTGENDFALLKITARINGEALPASFSWLLMDETNDSLLPADKVLVGGYPAGFLGGITVERELYIATSIASVQKFYTYNADTIDLISLSGTIASQKGVSGGAAVNQRNGKLSGIVTTSTDEVQTSDRELRAISTSHIMRSFSTQENRSLSSFLEGNLQSIQEEFAASKAPLLTEKLKTAIEKRGQ